MPRRPKFRPQIIRVRFNPEQEVLTSNCHVSEPIRSYKAAPYTCVALFGGGGGR